MSYQTLIDTATILVVSLLIHLLRSNRTPKLPLLGNSTSEGLGRILAEAYSEYPKCLFALDSAHHQTVVLPISLLDEVKSLPEHQLSLAESFSHRFFGQYTSIGLPPAAEIKAIRLDLTSNIASSLDHLQDECTYAFSTGVPECPTNTWTPVHVYPVLTRMIALLSSRVFVGLPLSRDDKWVNITVDYTMDAFHCLSKLRDYRNFVRPFVAPFLSETKAIRRHFANAKMLLKPVLEQRLKDMETPGFQSPNDLMGVSSIGKRICFLLAFTLSIHLELIFTANHSYLIVGHQTGQCGKSLDYQVNSQILVSLAAIHTTSQQLVHTVYDLALRPEYLVPLREELESILAEHNGTLVKPSMAKLKKMDSFLKEVQRINPISMLSITRYTTSTLKLSTGDILPKGTHTAFSLAGVSRDPSIWDNADEFDGFRFEKLRERPGQEHSHQFVTTGKNSFAFGYGTHACPGRFFASNEMKVILAHIILHYDIQILERPENIYSITEITPNPMAKVMFQHQEHSLQYLRNHNLKIVKTSSIESLSRRLFRCELANHFVCVVENNLYRYFSGGP